MYGHATKNKLGSVKAVQTAKNVVIEDCLFISEVVSNWEGKDVILISDVAECALYMDSCNVEENFDTVFKFDSACSRNMSGINRSGQHNFG